MTIGTWIGGAIFEAGREIAARVKAFGRKRTPEADRRDLEVWNRNHLPNLTTGVCLVCGTPDAKDTEHCPGPRK